MAVATSSGKETCNIKLERYTDLCSYFSHIVMGSSDIEVVHGKPSPDIFFVAAKRFPDSPAPDKVWQHDYKVIRGIMLTHPQYFPAATKPLV